MLLHQTFKRLAAAGFFAIIANTSSAATFSLDLTNGSFTSLPGNYSLAVPLDPNAIVDFQGDGSNFDFQFGGLMLNGANSNTRLTYI